jgi:phosphatidylinositol kinase/protein kinase (PI-3  family)
MNDLSARVFELVNSHNVLEQTDGILLIEELIEFKYDDRYAMIVRFVNALRLLLENQSDPHVLAMAARSLGHLTQSGGAMTVDIVEIEVKRAFEWLQSSKSEHRRQAATFVLKELAEHTPTLFNVHVSSFLLHIWAALRDSKLPIREGGAAALRAVMNDIAKRAHRWKLQCYTKIYKEADQGLNDRSTAVIHGSLLALGELLVASGDHLVSRFKQVCDTVLRFGNNSNTMIRDTVASLIPRLAALCPQPFVTDYLKVCVTFFVKRLKSGSSLAVTLLALGECAVAVNQDFVPYLKMVFHFIETELRGGHKRKHAHTDEALQCVGMLARAVGSQLTEYVTPLIDELFDIELCQPLVHALTDLSTNITDLQGGIQERLLDTITDILRSFDPNHDVSALPKVPEKVVIPLYGCPHVYSDTDASSAAGDAKSNGRQHLVGVTHALALQVRRSVRPYYPNLAAKLRAANASIDDMKHGVHLVTLALTTLGKFNFGTWRLLGFVSGSVLPYLDDVHQAIRKATAVTCISLLLKSGDDRKYSHTTKVRFEILTRLATAAIADADASIRLTILSSLEPSLDVYLAQRSLLSILFVALNDEDFAVRERAITLLGRLSRRNPAFVLPYLRKLLIQLLAELKQFDADTLNQEQSAKLLGHLIASAPVLIKPYVRSILDVLVPKLETSRSGVVVCVLSTLGNLALTGGVLMGPNLDQIISCILRILQDKTATARRAIALTTLSRIVSSTGAAIDPYLQYPTLLPVILATLKGEQNWQIRREVYKVLGVIGALDPHKYKLSLAPFSSGTKSLDDPSTAAAIAAVAAGAGAGGGAGAGAGAGDDYDHKTRGGVPGPSVGAEMKQLGADDLSSSANGAAGAVPPGTLPGGAKLLPSMLSNQEDFYPTVAIDSLMRILRNPNLSQHHSNVIKAVMFIFRSLGLKCVHFLPQIIPPFLQEMRHCEESLRENFFHQLANLVSIVKQHCRPYLNNIFDLMLEFWDQDHLLGPMLNLIEHIAIGVRDDFATFVPRLIPPILDLLHSDRSGRKHTAMRILHTLHVLSSIGSLNDYLFVMIPELIRVCEQVDVPVAVRMAAVRVVAHLIKSQHLIDFASRIVHPFARILLQPYSQLHVEVMKALCFLVYKLGLNYLSFAPMMYKVFQRSNSNIAIQITQHKIYHTYRAMISELQSRRSLSDGARGGFGMLSHRSPAMHGLDASQAGSNDNTGTDSSTIDDYKKGPALSQQHNLLPPQMQQHDSKHQHSQAQQQPHQQLQSQKQKQQQRDMGRDDLSELDLVDWNNQHTETVLFETIRPEDFLERLPNEKKMATAADSMAMDVHDGSSAQRVHVSQPNLKRAWEASQRSTADDWSEWMRGLSIELLKESPSPALRACSGLANKYRPLARDLFNAAFFSCWAELFDRYQDDLIHNLEIALKANNIPQKVVHSLLVLVEFMEQDDKGLPIDTHVLSDAAERFHAFAKALHYKEVEFQSTPDKTVDALISINNQLQQPDAAMGILKFAQQNLDVKLREQWYEKLHRWEEALETYERAQLVFPYQTSVTLGRMRCLDALGDWERLITLSQELWEREEDFTIRQQIAPLGADAAWNLGRWDMLQDFVHCIDETHAHGSFYRAILCIHRGNFDQARIHIDGTRRALDAEVTALVAESYSRAYRLIVILQQLVELEEVIQYKTGSTYRKRFIRAMWNKRLLGCQHDVDVWHRLMSVRRFVVPPREDELTWVRFSNLCRKSGRLALSLKLLRTLLGVDPIDCVRADSKVKLPGDRPFITYGAVKHLWSAGYRHQAFAELQKLVVHPVFEHKDPELKKLHSKCYIKLGGWMLQTDQEARNLLPMHSIAELLATPSSQRASQNRNVGTASPFSSPVRRYQVRQKAEPPRDAIHEHPRVRGEDDCSDATRARTPLAKAAAVPQATNGQDASPPALELAAPVMSSEPAAANSAQHVASISSDSHANGVVVVSVDADDTDNDDSSAASPVVMSGAQAKSRSDSGKFVHSTDSSTADVDGQPTSPLRVPAHARMRSRPSLIPIHDFSTSMPQILHYCAEATRCDPSRYAAWHLWAVMNYRAVTFYRQTERLEKMQEYVVPALVGFFKSIARQTNNGNSHGLQDILRLLTLWFEHGSRRDVAQAFVDGFNTIGVDTWLAVIPQIIARIDTPSHDIRRLVHEALGKIGKVHPQALVYPLTVAAKSPAPARKQAGIILLNQMRQHSPVLVADAELVGTELIRVAILWNELWHEGIEEAFRCLFGRRDVEGFLSTLSDLHAMVRRGATTKKEHAFLKQYGQILDDADKWCKKYMRSGHQSDLTRATDLYNTVLKKTHKQIGQVTHLELQDISPALVEANDMKLAVPGTYVANGNEVVRIARFEASLKVIESKQHPRKLRIVGSDGKTYAFLLKGHEDLRQDERVMQLFGLVNALLAADWETSRRDLDIVRYEVIPLSPNSGLIEWVPHCDTLHILIKQYRDARHIMLSIEQMLLLRMAPDYLTMSSIQKVEVFEHALANTTGQDLCRVLWLKSNNAESWLDRRTHYTRSLAVMSMVGYILGLGDRHTCNIMIDRMSGKAVHIDFGDCFEVAMHREKFPEKIPFRLTRMLINAMEVSGIEGNFRTTCELVMQMLRENKESVMAVLEAFVHDPLINWRLLENKRNNNAHDNRHDAKESDVAQQMDSKDPDAPQEILNRKALSVISRVEDKLTGRDFDKNTMLNVQEQIQRLIEEATSHINLCQCYIGWCPFW